MTDREVAMKYLKEAEEFLSTFGGLPLVEEFLQSEKTKAFISEKYKEMIGEMSELKANVPAVLSELAEKLLELFSNREEDFVGDVALNMKVNLYRDFKRIPEAFIKTVQGQGLLLQKVFEERSKDFQKDLELLLCEMKQFHVNAYLEAIYEDFVPEGMTEDMVSFLKMISGGNVLIPITAIFPDFGKEDDEETLN